MNFIILLQIAILLTVEEEFQYRETLIFSPSYCLDFGRSIKVNRFLHTFLILLLLFSYSYAVNPIIGILHYNLLSLIKSLVDF